MASSAPLPWTSTVALPQAAAILTRPQAAPRSAPASVPAPTSTAVRSRRAVRDAASADRHLAAELERRGFVLHRRLVRADLPVLDHVVVASSGIWLVSREHVRCARVTVRGRYSSRPTLRVGQRDRTALIDDLDRQTTALRGLLFDQLDVPIRTALCLPGAEFPLLRTLTIDDHLIVRPPQLLDHLERRGPVKRTRARELAALLDARLG